MTPHSFYCPEKPSQELVLMVQVALDPTSPQAAKTHIGVERQTESSCSPIDPLGLLSTPSVRLDGFLAILLSGRAALYRYAHAGPCTCFLFGYDL